MNAAETPPTAQEMFVLGCSKVPLEPLCSFAAFFGMLHFPLQRLNKAGHGDQDRHSLTAYGTNQFGRLQRIGEQHRTGQQWWDEDAQHLPEDMAQRKQIQKP